MRPEPLDPHNSFLEINGDKYRNLHHYSNYHRYQGLSVRLDPRHTREFLATAEKTWNSIYPDYIYSYTFLDERIADFYFLDNILLTLVELFAGIAIFLGSPASDFITGTAIPVDGGYSVQG